MSRSTRVPPDRRRDDPAEPVPMLEWWRGIYDHVFVALHPFVAKEAVGPTVPEREKAGAHMSWCELARDLGGPAFSDFAIALVLASYGIRPGLRRELGLPMPPDDLIDRLHDAVGARALDYPWDDSISPALEVPLADAFGRIGAETVVAWTEFREASVFVPVSALAATGTNWRDKLGQPVHALQDGQGQMLVTASFDDLWSLIALTDAARSVVRPETLLEGFWSGPETRSDWLNQPCSPPAPGNWP